jgi:thermitase
MFGRSNPGNFIKVFLVLSFWIFSALARAMPHAEPQSVPGQFLVKIRRTSSPSAVHRWLQNTGTFVKSRLRDRGIMVVQRPSFEYPATSKMNFAQNPDIEFVEPNFIFHADEAPNDPDFSKLWQYQNEGHNLIGYDLNMQRAWDVTTGSSRIIVAVLDTGIDYTHPDLEENMWVNQKEMHGYVGVDDDQNGFVDDINGFNFVDGNGDIMDDGGHGTHCAGTIGARGNNGLGIVGINWKVQLMALKFMDGHGSGTTENVIRSIDYAVQMGARVLSNSWGGISQSSQLLKEAIARANAAGVLFVAAAGNESNNNDQMAIYPGGYGVPNIISVASIARDGNLAASSNYGLKSVDLAAPGVDIYSTSLNHGYETRSGTSMATPLVAGVAALVLSVKPNLSVTALRRCLLNSVSPLDSLKNITRTGGTLNAYGALINSCRD